MTLNQLITEATSKDEDFKKRMDYWLITRKKTPDLDWIMSHLTSILGRDYVETAARQYIKSQKE